MSDQTCQRISKDLPRRMLQIIASSMVHDLGIGAEVNVNDQTGAPVIESEVGNIIYFSSSNSFRIFLKEPGELGVTHITVKGSPEELLQKIKGIHNGQANNCRENG